MPLAATADVFLTNYLPAKKTYGGRINIYYKQPNINTRLFTDLMKGPTATFDVTVGHEGFLVGAEGGAGTVSRK